MKRILVCFGDEQQEQPIVERVLKDMHVDYHILQDASLSQCVANLMGLPGFDEIPDARPTHHSIDPMLFEDTSDKEIQKVNECLWTKGTAMQRKAMLIEYSRDWIFRSLLSGVEREHIYFQTMDAICTLLVRSSGLVIETYTPAPWKSYEQVFCQAYECMSRECSMEELNGAYEVLSSAKKPFEPAE